MSPPVIANFENLKLDIANSVINSISDDEPLVVESDASNYALAATLSQNERPIAFFSRSLSNCEKKHPSIEKEAYAIVEALRKWRHFIYIYIIILLNNLYILSNLTCTCG